MKRNQRNLKSCYFHSSPQKLVISNSNPQLEVSLVANRSERRKLSQRRSQQLHSSAAASPQLPCSVALTLSRLHRCSVVKKRRTHSVAKTSLLPVCSVPPSQLDLCLELLLLQEAFLEQQPLPASSRALHCLAARMQRKLTRKMIQATKKKIKERRALQLMQIPTKSSSSRLSVKLFRRTPSLKRLTRRSTSLRLSSHCHPLLRTRKVNPCPRSQGISETVARP